MAARSNARRLGCSGAPGAQRSAKPYLGAAPTIARRANQRRHAPPPPPKRRTLRGKMGSVAAALGGCVAPGREASTHGGAGGEGLTVCMFCHEALGLSVLAGALGFATPREDLRLPWTVPFLVQEGLMDARSADAAGIAPITLHCIEFERHTSAHARQPPVVDRRRLSNAERVVTSYLDRLASLAAQGQAQLPRTAAAQLLGGFPDVWAAWLTVEAEAEMTDRLRHARMLMSTSIAVTDEMVELWLQRRAVLVLHDEEGFEGLLAAYGTRCRPALVHYVALRRPLSAEHASWLQDLAIAHGELEAADWAASQRRSS